MFSLRGLGIVVWGMLMLCCASSCFAEDFSFQVYNNADVGITEVLVKESGGGWGSFDIGGLISPGETVTLIWAEHTNDEDCEQWIKAVFADGSVAEPAKFDFCERGLVIEFE